MIWKQKLLTHATKADVLKFFRDLQEFRDQCARFSLEKETVFQARLGHFIENAKRMRNNLCEALRAQDIGEREKPVIELPPDSLCLTERFHSSQPVEAAGCGSETGT
jgi:hypothetical protein